MSQRIAIIDTETGGLDEENHSLLSVSIIITTERFEPIEDFTVFIKQDVYHVTQKALATNQIDILQADRWTSVEDAKLQIAQFLKFKPEVLDTSSDFKERKDDKWRFVGKNPEFDKKFLLKLFGNKVFYRMFAYWTECVFREMFLPLQRMGGFRRPNSGTLSDVCEAAGIKVDHNLTHTSEYDCILTSQLAQKCLKLEEMVAKVMAERQKKPVLNPSIPRQPHAAQRPRHSEP